MIINPILVGVIGTLFVEMAIIFIGIAVSMAKGKKG